MIKTNNSNFLKYLSYYDLINKYSLKSIYFVPQINKINLKIAIEQNLAVKLKAQYKAFLFFYLYNFCCSKVILNYFTSLKKKIKTISLKSKIILDISHKKFFDFLIFLIFLLNNKSLKSSCTSGLVTSNSISGKPHYQNLHLVFFTSASNFFKKTNQNHEQINFNDLTVFYSFSLKKSVALLPFNFFEKKQNLNKNFFKNIFIFSALKF